MSSIVVDQKQSYKHAYPSHSDKRYAYHVAAIGIFVALVLTALLTLLLTITMQSAGFEQQLNPLLPSPIFQRMYNERADTA